MVISICCSISCFGDTNLTCASTQGTLIGETFDGNILSVPILSVVTPPNYYTALLNAPGAVKIVAIFGLLSAGTMLGLGLVLGFPMLIYRNSRTAMRIRYSQRSAIGAYLVALILPLAFNPFTTQPFTASK